jgi:transposase
MSLPDFSTQSWLFSTAGLSANLFSPTDRYRLFAGLVYPKLAATRAKLEACYCPDNGRVAVEPVLLLGVSLLQYLEGMPDRQAVDMVRYHAGWNFALNRQVGDELFHPTTLVNFRQRLLDHELSRLGFQTVVDALVEAGLVARQSRQRLDSTQMFGCLSRMSRLDCVRESLRLGLKELGELLQPECRPEFWTELWERYVESQVDYRAGPEVLTGKMIQAGTDAQRLLGWLRSQSQEKLSQAEQVRLLARVFDEQYEVVAGKADPRPKSKDQLSSDHVHNPNEPEATYATKGQGQGKKEHVGYKVQVAETVKETELQAGEPTQNFLTGIVTQPAHHSDEAGAIQMEREQAALGLEKPPVQYVDGAYVSAERLAQVKAEGRQLMGPAQPAPANVGGRFTTEDFDIQVEQRRAICPAGKESTQCSRLVDHQTGKVDYRFGWSQHCEDCLLRAQCVGPNQTQRTVLVGEHHSQLQARRREQQTPEFAQQMNHRPAIEGTQSELVRAHGLRHARYRGLAKVSLQNYFIGAACNIKRWIRRQIWQLHQADLCGAAAAASPMAN